MIEYQSYIVLHQNDVYYLYKDTEDAPNVMTIERYNCFGDIYDGRAQSYSSISLKRDYTQYTANELLSIFVKDKNLLGQAYIFNADDLSAMWDRETFVEIDDCCTGKAE